MAFRFLIAIVWSGALLASHPKTDTVKVVNGNVITGEISSLSRGVLTVKTDSLGTLSIKWEDVRALRSRYTYEIYLVDGRVLYADLHTDPDSSDLIVTSEGATEKISLWQVVTLIPIASRLWRRFNGAASIGYSYYKSNTTAQFTIDSDLRYVTRKREADMSFSAVLVNQQTLAPTRRILAQIAMRENLKNRYFIAFMSQFARNDELQLARRVLVGSALGRDIIRTNRSILSVLAGLAYSRERYFGQEPQNNLEALIGTQYQYFRLSSPKVDITAYFNLWPNLSTPGRVRMDSNISSRFELYKDVFFSLSAFDSYDNNTPGVGAVQNDYGIVMSIGFSFNR